MTVKHTTKPINVAVNIKPVKLAEVSPAQRQLYKRFFTKLIAQVQDEMKNDCQG